MRLFLVLAFGIFPLQFSAVRAENMHISLECLQQENESRTKAKDGAEKVEKEPLIVALIEFYDSDKALLYNKQIPRGAVADWSDYSAKVTQTKILLLSKFKPAYAKVSNGWWIIDRVNGSAWHHYFTEDLVGTRTTISGTSTCEARIVSNRKF